MAKIPLGPIFEDTLGIGQVTSKEELDEVVKKIEGSGEEDLGIHAGSDYDDDARVKKLSEIIDSSPDS